MTESSFWGTIPLITNQQHSITRVLSVLNVHTVNGLLSSCRLCSVIIGFFSYFECTKNWETTLLSEVITILTCFFLNKFDTLNMDNLLPQNFFGKMWTIGSIFQPHLDSIYSWWGVIIWTLEMEQIQLCWLNPTFPLVNHVNWIPEIDEPFWNLQDCPLLSVTSKLTLFVKTHQ